MNYLRKSSTSLLLISLFTVTFGLFSFFPVRIDLSKGKAYTLSASTKKLIEKNAKNIDIDLYVSSDLPTRIIPLKTEVVELLQEYRRGGKNIKLNIIDPKKDPKIIEKLKTLGIPELQFSQLEQNKYQTSSFYFGIVLTQADKNELIPQVSDFQNLEYNITSALFRLTRSEMPKVAIIGEVAPGFQQQDPLTSLKKVLSQQYAISSVDLSTIKPEDANPLKDYETVLLLDNGTIQYSSEQLQLLKKFYESGKNILVFAGGTSIDDRSLSVMQANHNLNELTATYGAFINYDFVLSASAEYVNFGNELSQFLAPYPFWIRSNLFDTKTGLFANIQFITFPWVSSLSLKQAKNTTVSPIIISSDKSWTQSKTFVLNPNAIPQPTVKDLKQYTLGATIKNKSGGVMVVIPSSRFVYEQYMSRGSGNIDFILNTVDSVSSSGALSGIRSRIVSFYPLKDLTDSEKDIYKYSAMLLFPLMWGVYGVVRLMKRK